MSATAAAWSHLARSVEAAGGPRFVPVSVEEIEAIRRSFALPQWFEALLRIGYPEAPLRVAHFEFFPPFAELLAFGDEDPSWPRAWLPIEHSDGHIIYLVSADADAGDRVWRFIVDGPVDDDYELPIAPEWSSFAELLAILEALWLTAREDAWVVRAGKRWFHREAIARLAARLGEERARAALEWFVIPTVEDVRAAWRSERLEAIVAASISGFFTLVAIAVSVAPGHGGWRTGVLVALVFGAIPGGLLIYTGRSWLRVHRLLRSIEGA